MSAKTLALLFKGILLIQKFYIMYTEYSYLHLYCHSHLLGNLSKSEVPQLRVVRTGIHVVHRRRSRLVHISSVPAESDIHD